jgi:hypothetical protein
VSDDSADRIEAVEVRDEPRLSRRKPPTRRPRRVFVAYPYSFPEDDYRRPFTDLAEAFDVKFQFADERITSQHILEKITKMIADARFSLFDVTSWNPNVALELGIAMGRPKADYYLLFNPDHPDNPKDGVPSDLGGFDRIEYRSFAQLGEGVSKLLVQEFGIPEKDQEQDPVADLRTKTMDILSAEPGLSIVKLANQLNTTAPMARVVVLPMIEEGLVTTRGERRGMRYFPSIQPNE